jgi:GNAT superfamily N-acetyltransferase
VHIRTATATDHDACYAICIATAADGQPAGDAYRHPELLGDVYVGPYLALEPAHCLVLVDDADTPMGYAIGTPDTAGFAVRAESAWWPTVRARAAALAELTPADEALVRLIGSPPLPPADVVARFPAHGHVDLLPAAQGAGWGRRLLSSLEDSVSSAGAPAIHLGVSATNTRALGFYARCGYVELVRDHATVWIGRDLGAHAAPAR